MTATVVCVCVCVKSFHQNHDVGWIPGSGYEITSTSELSDAFGVFLDYCLLLPVKICKLPAEEGSNTH